jgi:hypothetical protein
MRRRIKFDMEMIIHTTLMPLPYNNVKVSLHIAQFILLAKINKKIVGLLCFNLQLELLRDFQLYLECNYRILKKREIKFSCEFNWLLAGIKKLPSSALKKLGTYIFQFPLVLQQAALSVTSALLPLVYVDCLSH